eukprot:CAMPEP_0117451870 /NCGR_PEP_ID=MMETSP0759-20121206/9256_1 /TAXON_ID=63605 /ORGANISM="Percolomonas cosmopolitus, Strain WS" /LENGTH=974 /DNA_ID=CAMNT_0005244535 /DNA_START=127 /DNA_END=3051 /DNA_ORIENTATION=+
MHPQSSLSPHDCTSSNHTKTLRYSLIAIFSDIQSATHSAKFNHLISIYSMHDIFVELMRVMDEDAFGKHQFAQNDASSISSIPNLTEHILILLRELCQNHSHLLLVDRIPEYLDELLKNMCQIQETCTQSAAIDQNSPASQRLRHAQKLLRRYTLLCVQLLTLYHSQHSQNNNFVQHFYENLCGKCFSNMPHLSLYFMEHAFACVQPFLQVKQVENLLVSSLKTFHSEPLQFVTFLIERCDEDDADPSESPLYSLIHNSIQFVNNILRSTHGLSFFSSISVEFMHQLMQLLNEYATFVLDERHVQLVFELLLDILHREKNEDPFYPLSLRGEILNTLLVNFVPCHVEYAEKEGYLRDALNLCLSLMAQNESGFEEGSRIFKETAPLLTRSAFSSLLNLVKQEIHSPLTSLSSKVSALTMLGTATSLSSDSLHMYSGTILQIIRAPLQNEVSSNLKRHSLLALCRCMRIVRKDIQKDLQPILDIMLSGLLSSNPPDDSLQLAILRAIVELDLKNYSCGPSQSVVGTHYIALHLIRCYDSSSIPRVQYETVTCLADIISNSAPNKDWDSAFDQILSFLLKVMESREHTKFSNLIKKTTTECIGHLCKHAKRTTTFTKYLPQIMEQYMRILVNDPESELTDSIFSFISDVSHIMKSHLTQYLPHIFRVVIDTLKITNQEKVVMKKLKHSGGYSRSHERHAAMEVVDSVLQNVPYPKLTSFLPSLIDVLLDLARVSSMHTHNDLLLMDVLKCVGRIYHIIRQNPQQLSGKRRKLESDTSALPWKRRRVETAHGRVAVGSNCENVSHGEDTEYSVSRANNEEKSLVAFLRTFNGILSLSNLSAEVKICALQQLQSASMYLVKELTEERKMEIVQSLYQLINSRIILQYAVHEQVSLTARLVEICQLLQMRGIEAELKKSSVDVMTAYMVQKMQNPRRSSDCYFGDEADFGSENDFVDAFDIFEARKEEVELIHRFTMNC